METQKEALEILDLTGNPGFSVKNYCITAVNQAAAGLMIVPGTDVRTLLMTGQAEYEAFQGGCLYLKLNIQSAGIGTTVVRLDQEDIFLPDPDYADSALQAMALTSVHLRDPLTSAMSELEVLMAREDHSSREALCRMNRALYKIHRMLCNLSDAGNLSQNARLETRNMGNLFAEIFEKAQSTLEKAGRKLVFQPLEDDIYSCADAALLERAILNMLSNALKFSPAGSTVHAGVSRVGRMLMVTVRDEGSGISQKVRNSIFSRYLRQPSQEEHRYGLGLGLVLIRSAASAHGGTVLIDQVDALGTRVTMTVAIQPAKDSRLRSPVLQVDYAGERDHTLVELSDILPSELYCN